MFKPIEPIPVEGKYEVLITFTKPIDTKDKKRQRILKHFGTWDNEDVKTINQQPRGRAARYVVLKRYLYSGLIPL